MWVLISLRTGAYDIHFLNNRKAAVAIRAHDGRTMRGNHSRGETSVALVAVGVVVASKTLLIKKYDF